METQSLLMCSSILYFCLLSVCLRLLCLDGRRHALRQLCQGAAIPACLQMGTTSQIYVSWTCRKILRFRMAGLGTAAAECVGLQLRSWRALVGMLPGEAEHTAGNTRFKDAMTMAIDHPDLLHASGKATGTAGKPLACHLYCVLRLLKAQCSMSRAQVDKVRAALHADALADGWKDRRNNQTEVGLLPPLLPGPSGLSHDAPVAHRRESWVLDAVTPRYQHRCLAAGAACNPATWSKLMCSHKCPARVIA